MSPNITLCINTGFLNFYANWLLIVRKYLTHYNMRLIICSVWWGEKYSTSYTAKFNSKTVPFVYSVCVSHYAHNRKQLFPHTALTGLCNASKLTSDVQGDSRFLWGACWLRTYVHNLILFLKELNRNVQITCMVQRKHRHACTTEGGTVNMPRYTQLALRASVNLI